MKSPIDGLEGKAAKRERISNPGFWPLIVAVPLIMIIVAATRWSLDHPYGIFWV